MTDTLDHLVQRLDALESRAAFYERMAEDLSQIVAAQADALDRLTLQLRHLAERQKSADADWRPSPQDGKPPPHY